MTLSDYETLVAHSKLNGIIPNKNWRNGLRMQKGRYYFARKFIYGNALDLGCCLGNGSQILSENCDGVVGADISKSALAIAKKYFSQEGIEYKLIKSGKRLPFKDNEFDCTVALETLDHVSDRRGFLDEIKRVTSGCIIISVCNAGVFGKDTYSHIHKKNYTPKSFMEELGKGWDFYGQNVGNKFRELKNSPCPHYLVAVGGSKHD